MFKKAATLSVLALLTAGACTPGKNLKDVGGQFWQRVSTSDAIYQQGPKAQQILNRDISRCVVELRELEELGTLKNAIPTDHAGRTLDPDEQALHDWDTPERLRNMYLEHSDYADFEGCMHHKGWERVEHVPFNVSNKGRKNYLKAHSDLDYDPSEYNTTRTKRHQTSNSDGDFGDLND